MISIAMVSNGARSDVAVLTGRVPGGIPSRRRA
jgi:hypothetical protein